MKQNDLFRFFLVGAFSLFFVLPWGYAHYAALLIFPVLIVFVSRRHSYYDLDFYFVFLFSLSYAIISVFGYWSEYGPGTILKYAILPWSSFLLGRAMVDLSRDDDILINGLFVILLFFSLVSIVSIGLDVYQNGFVSTSRGVKVLGEGDDLKNATGLNALISPWVSLIGLVFIKEKHNLWLRLLAFALSLLALVFTVRMGNRTGLVIASFALVFSYLYNTGRVSYYQRALLSVFVAGLVFLIPELDDSMLFAFQDRLYSDEYGVSSAGGRVQMMSYYFDNILNYPFGGVPQGYTGFAYAHNYFLDVAKISGLLPMLFAISSFFLSFVRLVKLLKSKEISTLLRNLLLFLMLACGSVFFVEPVIEGCFSLFLLYMFSYGTILSLTRRFSGGF